MVPSPRRKVRPRVLHLTRDHPPFAKGGLSWAVAHWVEASASALEHRILSFDAFRPTRSARLEKATSQPQETPTPAAGVHAGGAVHPLRATPDPSGDPPQTHPPVFRVRDLNDLDALPTSLAEVDLILIHDALLWEALPEHLRQTSAPKVLVAHVLHRPLRRLRGLKTETRSEAAQVALLQCVDAVATPSPWAADALRAEHPELRSPVHVLPPAIPDLLASPPSALTHEQPAPPPHASPPHEQPAPPPIEHLPRPERTTSALPHEQPAPPPHASPPHEQPAPPPIEHLPRPERTTSAHGAEHVSLLYLGRFDPLKGTADLLQAWPEIAAAHPHATLTLLGGNAERPARAQRWRRRWEANASADLRARTRWLPWCDRTRVAELLRAADLLVAPSHIETFGLGIAEALLAECPVVSSDAGAHGQWLREAGGALLVPAGDVAALRDGIDALLRAPHLRRRLATRGRAHILRAHAPPVAAAALLSLVEAHCA